ELDELPHHLRLAQHLGDGEHQVGGGHAGAQLSLQVHAHHVGSEEVDRLAEHGRLGLDAAYAPGDDAQAVDHGRMRVGADQRVGEGPAVLLDDALGQVLEVDLV